MVVDLRRSDGGDGFKEQKKGEVEEEMVVS